MVSAIEMAEGVPVEVIVMGIKDCFYCGLWHLGMLELWWKVIFPLFTDGVSCNRRITLKAFSRFLSLFFLVLYRAET